MTIAEKLLRAKNDIDEVHEAGYKEGYADCSVTLDEIIDGSITSISINTLTEIGSRALIDRESLENIDFPNVVKVGDMAVCSCYSLKKVNLPNCSIFEGEMNFAYCDTLQSIDLPKVERMGYAVFEGCLNLTSVTIRTPFVCISGNSLFYETPIAEGNGYIYVPADLVDSYKSATNWSLYADQIRAIQE